MAYYVGEHFREELVEAALQDPSRADSLVQKYQECRPPVSFDHELSGVMVLRTLYDIYRHERNTGGDDDG